MDSASFEFVLFGLAAAVIVNFRRSSAWRSAVLFVATLLFFALVARTPLLWVPLAGFLLAGYLGLMLIRRGFSSASAFSVVAILCAYVWLKKYTFLPERMFLQMPYTTLGLSYIFFRVLHLLLEAPESAPVREMSLGAYLLYNLNFTTFIAGPIQRYDDFARDQFTSQPLSLGLPVVGLQLERIVRGLFKVDVLATLFDAVRRDALIQMTQHLSAPVKAWAVLRLFLIYPFFLYCNFSGYIDIVIALARLMRLRLPENFDRPFSATSFLDFWNRWHITLSTWLKRYVYNPLLLVLMRRFSSRALEPYLGVFSFFVTFFLIGIWHGRTSEFVVFGFLQGGGVAINKVWQIAVAGAVGRKRYKEIANTAFYNAVGRGLTFTWFAFTLLWFWGTWRDIKAVGHALSPFSWLGVTLGAWLMMTVVLALWETLRSALAGIEVGHQPVLTSRYARMAYASAMAFATLMLSLVLSQSAPAIVYKAF